MGRHRDRSDSEGTVAAGVRAAAGGPDGQGAGVSVDDGEVADGELDMPDGSVARGYRAPGIHGTLPEGWRVYDIMECDSERWTPYPGYEDVAEADREDGENGRYETSLVIDDNPGPHFVDQGDPFVTRHDLSGVDWEFDEGHCGYDGVQLSDDIARLAAAAMPVMESARTEPIR